jgi:EAL domain-containing protein (putative c-di-GMP-specific phosphodiesterase class I)
VTAIITLGRSLGLRLVAEGVETLGQADFLRDQSCERVQGFHFYRPSNADDALKILQKEHEHLG